MGLFKNFIPTYRFKKITDIKPELFEGAQLVIFDLDSTLVLAETYTTTPEILSWLSEIKKRYHCIIFSNSFNYYHRAPKIAQIFGLETFLSKTKKPFGKLFLQMKETYGFENDKVFVLGDRVFTDILFGNRHGAKTVLIDSLGGHENFIIYGTRFFEWLILLINKANYASD